jgi:hypothetical protein
MGERAIKTISHPSAIKTRRRRTASRMRRLTRLRTTALPMRLLAAKPKRLYSKSLGRAHKTIKRLAHDLPFCRTRWKSALSLRRYLRSILFYRFTSSPDPLADSPAYRPANSPDAAIPNLREGRALREANRHSSLFVSDDGLWGPSCADPSNAAP